MKALATKEDVEAILGRALTSAEAAKIDAILNKLSDLFRLEAGQTFTKDESEVRLKVNAGKVYLPQKPVTEIVSVKDDDGNTVQFTQFQQWLTVPKISHEFVIVKYKHGSDTAPSIVISTIADAARQILLVGEQPAARGVTQFSETIGPETIQESYASWAQGGSTRLSPDDVAIARKFRVRVPNVWVMQS